jgi:hypothetical protein
MLLPRWQAHTSKVDTQIQERRVWIKEGMHVFKMARIGKERHEWITRRKPQVE